MKPEVTVIVTAYKREKFLSTAISSVLAQTFDSYEIIVTDDSHSEAIRQICESFRHLAIRYRTTESSSGVASSIAGSLREAKGEYVAILNDDDAWTPDFLQKLVPPLKQDINRVLAFSDHWLMNEEGMIDHTLTDQNTRRYGRASLGRGNVGNLTELALRETIPLAMASVFRKSAINPEQLFPEVRGAYDFWISCMLAASGKTAYYEPERLTLYRVHAASETARRSPDKYDNLIFIFEKLLGMNCFPDQTEFLKVQLGLGYFHAGKEKILFNQTKEARKCFLKSFLVGVSIKPLAGLIMSLLPKVARKAFGFTL